MKITKNSNFNLYYIDKDYLNYLMLFDSKVPYKEKRPYIGILIKVDKQLYLAPLTSKDRKSGSIYIKTLGKGLGGINLNNMIPCNENNIKKVNFKEFNSNDKYIKVLDKKLKFINKNKEQIYLKALNLYKLHKKNYKINKITPKNRYIKNLCCNFSKLEKACKEYNREKITT